MLQIIIFAALQLINVMFSTVKSIVQVKGTKLAATIVNSIYYAFYTVVVIFMVAEFTDNYVLNILIKVIITGITNLIGTWASMTLIEHFRKDKLWKIDITVHTQFAEEIHQQLKAVPHSFITITDRHTVFTFYCAKKEDSKLVKTVGDKYQAKYFVSESKIIL